MADSSTIKSALRQFFGFDSFKGNQLPAMESLLDGNDVFVLMPTGGGKSLCYQLPALMSEGTAIVISPLIALMKNQVDAVRAYCSDDSVAHFLNSSLNRAAIERVKSDVSAGRTKLLYVAPESLTKEDNIKFLKNVKISFFAVDEAHCISEWGHDFRPEYRRIRPIISQIGIRPVIALTATATPKVQHDIQRNLGMNDAKVFKSSFNRPNLYYEVKPKTRDVDREIIRFIKQNAGKSGIVYCLSRRKVEELSEFLNLNDIAALPYHAGMDSATRSENQDAFLQEKVNVIVATIAFGMGIDKPDVRFVIHYDIPKSLEGYYQETGRAGRDGGEGRCITFYSNKDLQKLDKLMQSKTSSEQEIGRQLLAETAAYAESSMCRRRILMHYFGENYESENCGNCDNCLHPKQKVNASEELLSLIETVEAAGERYRMDYIINILIGRATDEVKAGGHDSLELFGSINDKDDKFLATLVNQAVISGYLLRDIENYGILKLTPKGREFVDNPGEFFVLEDADFSEADSESYQHSVGAGATDYELFAMLRDLRKHVARKHDLPPYVIFQDPSLEAMATTYPINVDELLSIPGVGAGKAKRFGKEFVELIARHVEENDIIRPDDFKVRQVADKNKLKNYLVQGIDRRLDLHVLAEGRGLEFEELISELENIVESGVRINLDYFIDDFVEDDDRMKEVMDYFRTMEEDDVEIAKEDLSDDFDEDEVRLLRIKFISEMGN
ncbi:MAG: DNA helicase RecQ [Clostridium sp.]|nr:DNA helicase RecQ [Prevotella sp.]MCM1428650.1 DNA helicase RecQ [Clostridium sp.]MCM1475779.1 DNA helicase RecQ [Muribaculaceae bacterium]